MSTNWVRTQFCIVTEEGYNLLTEVDEDYISLDEFDNTEWTIESTVGTG
jgi:hypothetical protein